MATRIVDLMATTVRKIKRAGNRRLAELAWPVRVAMVLLAGFLMGASSVYQSFNDPRWWANAWTSLIAIPTIVLVCMVAIALTPQQWVRRTLQLALVLSASAHLFILSLLGAVVFAIPMVTINDEPLTVEYQPWLIVPTFQPYAVVADEHQQLQDVEHPIDATPAEASDPELQASAGMASIARSSDDPNAGSMNTQVPLEVPIAGPSASRGKSGSERTQAADAPSVSSSNATATAAARTARAADVAASRAAIDDDATAASKGGPDDPLAAPNRLAVTKGTAEGPGGAFASKPDTSSGEKQSPSLVASVPSRKAASVASGDSLPSAGAARMARRQGRIGGPSATELVQSPDAGSGGDGKATSGVDASASASATRGDGAGQAGAIGRSPGTSRVDSRPNTALTRAGQRRSKGGGQPGTSGSGSKLLMARRNTTGTGTGARADGLAGSPEASPGEDESGGDGSGGDGSGSGALSLEPSMGGVARSSGSDSPGSRGPGGIGNADGVGERSLGGGNALASGGKGNRATAGDGDGPAVGGGGGKGTKGERGGPLGRLARSGGGLTTSSGADKVGDIPNQPIGEAGGDAGDGGTGLAGTGLGGQGMARKSDDSSPLAGSALAGAAGDGGGAAGTGPGNGKPGRRGAITRAEGTGTGGGSSGLGNGTASLRRTTSGGTSSSPGDADQIEIGGDGTSGDGSGGDGTANAGQIAASGATTQRSGDGTAGTFGGGNVGSLIGDRTIGGPSSSRVGGAAGGRRQSGTGDGAELAATDRDTVGSGGTIKRTGSATGNLGVGDGAVAVPEIGAGSAVAQADEDHMPARAGGGSRASGGGDADGGVSVDLGTLDGPGGIGPNLKASAGINRREASSDVIEITLRTARFPRRENGGLPAISSSAVISTDGFQRRMNALSGSGGPSAQTKRSIELGLAFLAKHQQRNGSWSLQGYGEETQMVSDSAATALALLAFQGAGYHHREHKYKEQVRAGLDFLIKNQAANGDLFIAEDDESNASVWFYSHAMATLALCEAYGMTQDPELREPAQKAIDFLIATQNKDRGAWRYQPNVGSDSSVTGAVLVALKSGELANLNVPPEVYERISEWFDLAQASADQPYLYRYNPYAPDTESQRHGRKVSKAMTSVSLLARLYMGWKTGDQRMIAGAEYLKQNLPAIGTSGQPLRDTYYWYYASQVMYHMGGEYRTAWNERLLPILHESQVKEGAAAGSWNPRTPVPDRWGPHGGRLYVTTLNLLSLEVDYRSLPIYRGAVK